MNKYFIVSFLPLLFFASTFFLPQYSSAASTQVGTTGNTATQVGITGNTDASVPAGQTLVNPLKFDSLNSLLSAILGAVVQLGTILLTLALIWTGFKFVMARGNEEAIRNAKNALMWTVIGGLILLGATAIQKVIEATVAGITN